MLSCSTNEKMGFSDTPSGMTVMSHGEGADVWVRDEKRERESGKGTDEWRKVNTWPEKCSTFPSWGSGIIGCRNRKQLSHAPLAVRVYSTPVYGLMTEIKPPKPVGRTSWNILI